jgi:WD40 repeat protein
MRFTSALLAIVFPAVAFAQPKRPEVVLPVGHFGPVTSAAFSRDGRLAVTGSDDGSVVLWDAHSGEVLRRWSDHTRQVCSVGFGAGTSRIVSASFSGTLFIHDSAGGAVLHEIKCKDLAAAAFSRDGKRIYVAGTEPNDITILDGTTGERVRTIEAFGPGVGNRFGGFAISPDGSRLFAASESGEWVIWDADSAKRLAERKPEKPKNYAEFTAAFSPDGKSVLVAETRNAGAFRWDFSRAGAAPADLKLPGPVTAFDPTGRYALTGHVLGLPARVVDLKDGSSSRLEGVDWWRAACFTEDGARVLVGSFSVDREQSPLNTRVVISDARTGKTALAMQTAVLAPVLLRVRGTSLTVADREGGAAEWDLSVGDSPKQTRVAYPGWLSNEAATPDGRLRVAIESLGVLECRATLTASGEAKPRRTFGPFEFIQSVAITADGTRVATNLGFGKVVLWDAASGEQLHSIQAPGDHVHDLAFSPDGKRIVTAVRAGKLVFWDVQSGREVRTFEAGGEDLSTYALSPDGKRLVTALNAGKLIVWDAESGKQLRSFNVDGEPVVAVELTADAKRLFTTAFDGTTRVWDTATGKEIVRLVAMNDAKDWLVMTPDGSFDGSPTALKLAKVRTDGRFKLEPLENFAKNLRRPGLLQEVCKSLIPALR